MKKIWFGVLVVLLLIIGISSVSGIYILKNNNQQDDTKEKVYVFFESGKTTKEINVYSKTNNKYNVVGKINSNILLDFIKLDDNYLLIDGFNNEYFVNINDVEEYNGEKETTDNRYRKYIVFNENAITTETTTFYDKEGNWLYSFNTSYELPIIIKENDKYGVEFNNQLLYLNKDNIKETKSANNTTDKNTSGIGVLNYHFFYAKENADDRRDCNQYICKSTKDFQEELNYLKDNNIMTITAWELEAYIDGKINLPKSVLITIDDGWRMNQGIELLEKNEMHATVFLITSWWDNINFLNTYKYVEFHSHGDKLHDVGVCPGGQGGAIKCLAKDKLLNDLSISTEKLNGSKYIAYPFYEYNNYSIEVLKEAGYRMAFAGYYGDGLVHVGSDKYKIPRYVMYDYTTLNNLDNYFNKIK